jgi:hypothetical protein
MHWNYRVVKRQFKTLTGEDEIEYAIHEAYYDEDKKPNGVTENAVTVHAESKESLRWVLEKMIESLDKPVLDYDDLGKEEE